MALLILQIEQIFKFIQTEIADLSVSLYWRKACRDRRLGCRRAYSQVVRREAARHRWERRRRKLDSPRHGSCLLLPLHCNRGAAEAG